MVKESVHAETFGFVYIWYDTRFKMYYIGSHWGHVDDGYVCSSERVRGAQKRRRKDFKRRIVERVYTDRRELLETEQRWLDMVKQKDRYYNIHFKVRTGYTWIDNDTSAKRKKKRVGKPIKSRKNTERVRWDDERLTIARDQDTYDFMTGFLKLSHDDVIRSLEHRYVTETMYEISDGNGPEPDAVLFSDPRSVAHYQMAMEQGASLGQVLVSDRRPSPSMVICGDVETAQLYSVMLEGTRVGKAVSQMAVRMSELLQDDSYVAEVPVILFANGVMQSAVALAPYA